MVFDVSKVSYLLLGCTQIMAISVRFKRNTETIETVGENIALVSVTKLLVYGGTIYQNYVETKIGVLGQERCLTRN